MRTAGRRTGTRGGAIVAAVLACLVLVPTAQALPFFGKKKPTRALPARSVQAGAKDSTAAATAAVSDSSKLRHGKPQRFVDVPWQKGSSWISARAGYAKSASANAAPGLIGAGVGYARMWRQNWSLGAYLHDDLLGKFAASAEIEIPLTVELVRHSQWGAALHPYFGIGGGAFYHKYYRTGADASKVLAGEYLTFGANSMVNPHGVLGLDIRLASVKVPGGDPTFDREVRGVPENDGAPFDFLLTPGAPASSASSSALHVSAKISYGWIR